MLAPLEFSVGAICEARGLTLVLPRTKHEETILVTTVGERPVAIFVNEQHQFEGFECGTADNWKGLLVHGIAVEVDEASAFDSEQLYVPYGAVVRAGDRLSLAVRIQDSHSIYRQHLIPIVAGLPPCRDGVSVGFRKWQLVLGTGDNRRVLKNFDVAAIEGLPH